MKPRSLLRPLFLAALGLATLVAAHAQPAVATTPLANADGTLILDAREALRRRDKTRLAQLRALATEAQHPLAMWVDYWELSIRLPEATPEEVEAFYARHAGTYVEDRLRNDWLLELGRRKDLPRLAQDYPRFRMNDDREVTCWAHLAAHQAGRNVGEPARAAWLAQRDVDNGCSQLGAALAEARLLAADELWHRARRALDQDRPRLARQVAGWVDTHAARDVAEALDNPARYLRRAAAAGLSGPTHAELVLLALLRLAASDADSVAAQLDDRWAALLGPDRAAWAWASLGRRAALKLSPDAWWHFQRAWQAQPKGRPPSWGDDILAWNARAALRLAPEPGRWQALQQAVAAMSASAQADPAWAYWRARALLASAPTGAAGQPQRDQAQAQLRAMAGPLGYYPLLAAEAAGQEVGLPATPAEPSAEELAAVQRHTGLARSLRLIDLGLRSEGVREFNFSLRDLDERGLHAAAHWACERRVWDRCISASERTAGLVNLAQRYPAPHREQVSEAARAAGLDTALVYGLMRQESRFVEDARSGVGASGLMQLMPATARWTAAKLGLSYGGAMINDRNTNLRLGTHYLRLLVDDFGGALPLAVAGYNAGPNRPRRWRDGPSMDAAVWVENIPFNETRDYVKKVLANASLYAALLDGKPLRLGQHLGDPIGPRDASAPAANNELP